VIDDDGLSIDDRLTQQDRGSDSRPLNDFENNLTCIDNGSSEQFSRSLQTERDAVAQQSRLTNSSHSDRRGDSGGNTHLSRTGGGHPSSAMKLRSQRETSSQSTEHEITHDRSSPSSDLHSPVTPSPRVSVQGQKSADSNKQPLSSLSQPLASRPSTWSRGMMSNQPLGAEFDVKQITVRRPTNSTSSDSEPDFFVDMTPVITTSSATSEPQRSLLDILSPDTSSAQPYLVDTAVSRCS